jgi:hypothetical protein
MSLSLRFKDTGKRAYLLSLPGEYMEPKSPIKSRELKETLLPTVLYPIDTEDYFELACEDDEFGVHIPDQTDDK